MTKVTRKMFVEAALNCEIDKLQDESYQTVGKKMLASIIKQANRPKTKSPERLENEKKAVEIARILKERNTPVNATWITENVRGVLHPQKANAIMAVAIEMQLCERVTIAKKPYYVHVDWNPSTEE